MNEFQKVADYILGVSKLSQPQLREHLRNKKKSLEAKRERVQKMFPEGSLADEFLRIEIEQLDLQIQMIEEKK